MTWDESTMRAMGFVGFVPFTDLPRWSVPAGPGVYVVLRTADDLPTFLEHSVGGHFKGKDPSVSAAKLESNWITGSDVVYIGKADAGSTGRRGLAKRLDEYRRFGAGEPIGHWGGRYIWQLADHAELLVAWKDEPLAVAEDTEAALLTDFLSDFGSLPFANLKHGRRHTRQN
jgi:hypothetical protein